MQKNHRQGQEGEARNEMSELLGRWWNDKSSTKAGLPLHKPLEAAYPELTL